MQLGRYGLVMLIALLLQSCASPQMTEDLRQGKLTFESGEYHSAFHQLLPLAVAGNKEAQYAVGYMYYYGDGVSQDTESGIFWMNKSAEQHYPLAERALEIISERSYQPQSHPSPQPRVTVMKQTAENAVSATDPVLQALPEQHLHTAPARQLASLSERDYPAFHTKVVKHVANIPVVVAKAQQPYTLQLFGTYHLSDAEKLKTKLSLNHPMSIWQTKHNDKDWYVLTYGHYQNAHQAVLAKNALPAKLHQMSPWVREVDALKIIA